MHNKGGQFWHIDGILTNLGEEKNSKMKLLKAFFDILKNVLRILGFRAVKCQKFTSSIKK